MPRDEASKHLDAFDWFTKGDGSTRTDSERGALLSLGYAVAIAMARIAELERRLEELEQSRDAD